MTLAPGVEIVSGTNGQAFPNAYSSFAIQVDSRDATPPPSYPSSTASSAQRAPSPLNGQHFKSKSLYREFPRRSSPEMKALHGGRFGGARRGEKDGYEQYHHRRSSTAALVEYVKNHIKQESHKPPTAFTLKRAFLMFCIVFSATYLALALLPLMSRHATSVGSGYGGRQNPMRVTIKRGASYYGNSDIFQAGENLPDPHADGDEQLHNSYVSAAQVVGRARAQQQRQAAQPAAVKKLRSSNLQADQASLEELQEDDVVVVVRPAKAAAGSAKRDEDDAAPLLKPAQKKRPAMPFNRLKKEKDEPVPAAEGEVAQKVAGTEDVTTEQVVGADASKGQAKGAVRMDKQKKQQPLPARKILEIVDKDITM